MVLGDFGAEVLKIEAADRLDGRRGGGGLVDGQTGPTITPGSRLAINRNKKGLSLDLRTSAGRELFLRLAAVCDVVVENYTPRVMAGFGLAYEQLREVNERIVMIALSGFGATGPWRDLLRVRLSDRAGLRPHLSEWRAWRTTRGRRSAGHRRVGWRHRSVSRGGRARVAREDRRGRVRSTSASARC